MSVHFIHTGKTPTVHPQPRARLSRLFHLVPNIDVSTKHVRFINQSRIPSLTGTILGLITDKVLMHVGEDG